MRNMPSTTLKLLFCLAAILELAGTGCVWWGPDRRRDRGGAVIIDGGGHGGGDFHHDDYGR